MVDDMCVAGPTCQFHTLVACISQNVFLNHAVLISWTSVKMGVSLSSLKLQVWRAKIPVLHPNDQIPTLSMATAYSLQGAFTGKLFA